jgi:hypothetical protein
MHLPGARQYSPKMSTVHFSEDVIREFQGDQHGL